ncbi:hypothetical protein HDV62DRAFT_391518 [Trichoderma sp. SZMC 28011]
MSKTFTYAKEDANNITRYVKGYLQRVYECDVTTKYGYEGRIRPLLPINVVLADCADCQVCGTEIYGDKDIGLQTGTHKFWSPEMTNPQMKFAISATTNAIASNDIHKNDTGWYDVGTLLLPPETIRTTRVLETIMAQKCRETTPVDEGRRTGGRYPSRYGRRSSK